MAFHEIQFPTGIAYGSDGGPVRQTTIVQLESGYEARNTTFSQSLHQYNVAYGVKSYDDLHTLKEFFEARLGSLHGFRYKDFADFKSCPPLQTLSDTDQVLGTGDSVVTTFQIRKTYVSGSNSYIRDIKKPVAGSVVVSLDDVSQVSGWSVDTTTGIITFDTAPGNSVVVKAGFEFDVPVRFDLDLLQTRLSAYEYGETDVNLMEIRV